MLRYLQVSEDRASEAMERAEAEPLLRQLMRERDLPSVVLYLDDLAAPALHLVKLVCSLSEEEAEAAEERGQNWDAQHGMSLVSACIRGGLPQMGYGCRLACMLHACSATSDSADALERMLLDQGDTWPPAVRAAAGMLLEEAVTGYRPQRGWGLSASDIFLQKPTPKWLQTVSRLPPFVTGQAKQPRLKAFVSLGSSAEFRDESIAAAARARLKQLKTMRYLLLVDSEYKPMFGVESEFTGGFKRWWQASCRLMDLHTGKYIIYRCWTADVRGSWGRTAWA